MYYVVGLGNPGEKYALTRHNVGRIVLAEFFHSHRFPELVSSAKYSSLISEGNVDSTDVLVLFPETYMNKSGSAVAKAMDGEKDTAKLIVVYDDIDLPLGTVKVAYGRGSGGHRGIESIIQTLKTKHFVRVRVGVSPVSFFGNVKKPKGEQKVLDFLLSDFKKRELAVLEELSPRINDIITTIITKGHAVAMNEFNG